MSSEVKVKDGNIEDALKRFKRQCARNGVIQEVTGILRTVPKIPKFKWGGENMLKEKLLEDLKNSMKEKNVVRKNVVQMIRAAILQKEKDNQIELNDEEIMQIIAKEAKTRKDALPDYEKSGREDLIKEVKEEIAIIEEYLPKQLTKEEILPIIQEIINKTGASSIKDMGKVMGEAKKQLGVSADGKTISECVKELLSK